MSNLNSNELGSMTLQRLAYLLPQTLEEEAMVKEAFESRANVSTYQTLTTIDVKLGWQEKIIQKYVDIKRETMAPENPAFLTPEEESHLDTAVITKEKELELQAKLDERNHKKQPEQMLEVEGTSSSEPLNEVPNNESSNIFCEFCDAKGPVRHKANCTRSDNKVE